MENRQKGGDEDGVRRYGSFKVNELMRILEKWAYFEYRTAKERVRAVLTRMVNNEKHEVFDREVDERRLTRK